MVTLEATRRLARAAIPFFRECGEGDPSRPVLAAFDTRAHSAAIAREGASVLAAAGLPVLLADGPVPTPVVTHQLLERACSGAFMATASHNPAEDHGVKLFSAAGLAIADDASRAIEGRMNDCSAEPGDGAENRPQLVAAGLWCRDHADSLMRLLARTGGGLDALRVHYDAMHGASGALMPGLLEALGAEVAPLRCDPDPRFGGGAGPDPSPQGLAWLAERIRKDQCGGIGLATDGDGDRFGVVAEGGRILSEPEVIALLVDHLASSGAVASGVALTAGAGTLVRRVARMHGIPVRLVSAGFKHLSRALVGGQAEVAAEESGGFAIAAHALDKDGMLAGLLVAQIAASSANGLSGRLDALHERFGRFCSTRIAVPARSGLTERFGSLCAAPPERLGTAAVVQSSIQGGLFLEFDDGFALLRRSGTEPVFRIYAEAREPIGLMQRLRDCQDLLGLGA